MRSRGFCITAYETKPVFTNSQYSIIGDEICPKTNRPHYQCYVYYKEARQLKAVIKEFKPHHVEPAKGSPQQNIDYCSKEGKFEESGSRPTQGKRTDIELVVQSARDKRKFKDLVSDHPSTIRYEAHFKRAKSLFTDTHIYSKKTILIFWGETGTGKTRKAYTEYPDLYRVGSYKWFTSYDGEDVVLFDEFRPENMIFERLLELTDGYPVEVETKGGHAIFSPNTIIFTSNNDPRSWYPDKDMAPFFRRVSEVHHFENPFA